MNEMNITNIYNAITSLSCDINIYYPNGVSIFNENNILDDTVLQNVKSSLSQIGDKHYKYINIAGGYIIELSKTNEEKDILCLVEKLIEAYLKPNDTSNTLNSVIASAFNNSSINPLKFQQLLDELKINLETNYIVFLLNIKDSKFNIINSIESIYPSDTDDIIIPISKNHVAVVHYTGDTYSISDFISALYMSIEEEYGMHLSIGVSNLKKHFYDIRKAFSEAKKALSIYEKTGNSEFPICYYNNIIMERILLEINPQTRQNYVGNIFNLSQKKRLNEELLNTVIVFLKNNLNLTDTSKELFIHRNTLIYRLEKIYKLTGLNLNKFNDAVIFKLLYTMYKLNSNEKEKYEENK